MRFVCPDGIAEHRPWVERAVAELLTPAGHQLLWHPGPPDGLEGWIDRLGNADGALVGWQVPSGVLSRCPTLRVLSCASTGVERAVDWNEVAQRGTTVCNVPVYGSNAVAEHALALIFAVARRIASFDRALRSGRWMPSAVYELRGRRIGIVGAGPIGARMVQLSRAVGMEPVVWTRTATPERERALGAEIVPLPALFSTADVVSVHLPHTPSTERLIGAELLRRMKPDSILVNTARAQVIDRAALVEALNDGRLLGVGLDVFAQEPVDATDPLVEHPRTVATPHVAYDTAEAVSELYRVAVENLAAFAAGTPQHEVRPSGR